MTVPHSYPPPEPSATTTLVADLEAEIARRGSIPFPEFMAAALYDRSRGYYARETRQVGRGGDFFTSVSVGPVFGTLLARRFFNWWAETGPHEHWRILETGAHDGTLAADILTALQQIDTAAFEAVEYVTIEPLPLLATAQRTTLAAFGERAQVVESPGELTSLPGIAFGNELLDALPFNVLEWRGDRWNECRTIVSNNRFQWDASELWKGPAPLPTLPLPEGYRTELRSYEEVLKPLVAVLNPGLLLWIDYGFARPDYLAPERTTGTLRTFSRHRAGEDPFEAPGEADITAHVDFTAVAEAAIALGAVPAEFSSQGSWLTRLAGPWLAGQELSPDPAAIRQFQTLVHPAHLGARFQVLELSCGTAVDDEAREQTARRLAL